MSFGGPWPDGSKAKASVIGIIGCQSHWSGTENYCSRDSKRQHLRIHFDWLISQICSANGDGELHLGLDDWYVRWTLHFIGASTLDQGPIGKAHSQVL
jgi:hypothetical protein